MAFAEPDADGRQRLTLHSLTGDQARGDAGTGDLVLEGRTGETATDGDGVRLWAGHVKDSFYVDLSLLAIVNGAVANGTAVDLSAWRPDKAQNSFAGSTVRTIVLEVPHDEILSPGTPIGVWAATKLATDAGGWRQVNRAGHPMMWPIFWPNDIQFTDPANTRHPSEDYAAEGEHMADHVSAVVAATGTSAEPDVYGLTVAKTLLPDVLPYVVGTPASFGFATRNGRTLADNAPEAMMSLVVGAAVPGGLTPSVAEAQRSGPVPVPDPGPPASHAGPGTPAPGVTRLPARHGRDPSLAARPLRPGDGPGRAPVGEPTPVKPALAQPVAEGRARWRRPR